MRVRNPNTPNSASFVNVLQASETALTNTCDELKEYVVDIITTNTPSVVYTSFQTQLDLLLNTLKNR